MLDRNQTRNLHEVALNLIYLYVPYKHGQRELKRPMKYLQVPHYHFRILNIWSCLEIQPKTQLQKSISTDYEPPTTCTQPRGGVIILETRFIQKDCGGLKDRSTHACCPSQRAHTWEMSITASQLRGRAEVKSLKPRRVEMIPFWSILRIMVPSTKKITPYLSTVMPADKKLPNEQKRKYPLVVLFIWTLCIDRALLNVN